MYKTRLQELCQKKSWELPIYTTGKNGPCHVPRFTATVSVQGQVFETPEEFRSVKEAQNTAARIAFDHFNVSSPAEANASAPPTVNTQFQMASPPIPVPAAAAAPVVPPPELLPLSPLPSSHPNPPLGNYLLIYFPDFFNLIICLFCFIYLVVYVLLLLISF